MLSYTQFEKLMEQLKKVQSYGDEVNNTIGSLFEDFDGFFKPLVTIETELTDLIDELMEGTQSVPWYIYDNDWGSCGLTCSIDGTEYSMNNLQELYDFIQLEVADASNRD